MISYGRLKLCSRHFSTDRLLFIVLLLFNSISMCNRETNVWTLTSAFCNKIFSLDEKICLRLIVCKSSQIFLSNQTKPSSSRTMVQHKSACIYHKRQHRTTKHAGVQTFRTLPDSMTYWQSKANIKGASSPFNQFSDIHCHRALKALCNRAVKWN